MQSWAEIALTELVTRTDTGQPSIEKNSLIDQKIYLHCLAIVLSPGIATVRSSTSIAAVADSADGGKRAMEGDMISTGDSGTLRTSSGVGNDMEIC